MPVSFLYFVEELHYVSHYFLSTALSGKHFVSRLSNKLIVLLSFRIKIFQLIFYSEVFIKNTSFVKFTLQAIPIEIGITMNLKPIHDNVNELEVTAIIAEVSIVFNRVDKTLKVFSDLWFTILIFQVRHISFEILNRVTEAAYSNFSLF